MTSLLINEIDNDNFFQSFDNRSFISKNINENINANLNEFSYDSKEEPQSKQPIKFILIKQDPPQDNNNFLQRKTISKSIEQYSESENSNNGRWGKEEQKRFAEAVLNFGNDWKKIQNHVYSRNITQVRSHAQKFLMKLKEINFLKDKGLEKNLSWTKVMNYLGKVLTKNELKDVLFGVEQTGQKKKGKKNYKNLKKIKKSKNTENSENTNNNSINYSKSETNNSTLHCYEYDADDSNIFNLNEEDKYKIKHKFINQEEEDKEMLQKFIECFSPSSENKTLNTSFDEKSFKENDNNIGYKLFNEPENKYNNNYDIY